MQTRSQCLIAVIAAMLATPTLSQTTTRVSVGPNGAQANGSSDQAAISANGRYVAFVSNATNLVPGDTNGKSDVFVYHVTTGTTTRVSVGSAGAEANSASSGPSLSTDGRYVAFGSGASNLVAGDSNGKADVFVHDQTTGVTTLVSTDSSGNQANGSSYLPEISADGRWVAFISQANNLVASDTNSKDDVFVHDCQTGVTSRASVSSGGGEADDYSEMLSISGDGRYVAFVTCASNLVPGDTNSLNGFACEEVFVHDQMTGITTRENVDSNGGEADGMADTVSISNDGRYVVFHSWASNLVPGFGSGVCVHDRQSGATTALMTIPTGGATAPSVSSSGRYVRFGSSATNFVAPDSNGQPDEFVYDRTTGSTIRISNSSNGAQGNAASLPQGSPYNCAVSADGRYAVFWSQATNLVAADTNGVTDVFLSDRWDTCYLDADLDGFGAGSPLFQSPTGCGTGFAQNDLDCDDLNASVYPGAPELCDGLDNNCDGVADNTFISTYCTAGTTVHGCISEISGVGAPSSTSVSGFDIVVHSVEGQRNGLIFYGFYAIASPWALGSFSYLCVASPTQRMPIVSSGGTAGQCNGALSIDFNAWRQANPTGLGSPFVQGQIFYAQGWFRDPAAPKGTNLSNGLRFTLCN